MEALGIISSLLVLVSFLFNNMKMVRIVNIIACIVFIIYGISINSFSVIFLNGALIIVHIVKIIKEKGNKDGR